MATSTIRARFASERGRGFPSTRSCVGLARLLAIPFMLDPRSVGTIQGKKLFFNGFVKRSVNFDYPIGRGRDHRSFGMLRPRIKDPGLGWGEEEGSDGLIMERK